MPTVTVRVPGSIGNVGPGLDILGLAVAVGYDTVIARQAEGGAVAVRDAGHPDLPTAPDRNTAAIAAGAVRRMLGRAEGIELTIEKGLPLSGGQGGSAASAIGGAVAANALLGGNLDREGLLAAALEAEATVAGRHLDNLAPSLIGGLVLVRSVDPIVVIPLPAPPCSVVLVHPDQRMATRDARAALPATIERQVALDQAAAVATMVAAAHMGDAALFGAAIDDRIAEPVRGPLLPGFVEAKAAAQDAGALGVSISGAGPTAFALALDDAVAIEVGRAMVEAYAAVGLAARATVTTIDTTGATLA